VVCLLCKGQLFQSRDLVEHGDERCASYFIQKKDWISEQEGNQGSIRCPRKQCAVKLGVYCWAGVKCNCQRVVTPGFQILKSRVKLIPLVPGGEPKTLLPKSKASYGVKPETVSVYNQKVSPLLSVSSKRVESGSKGRSYKPYVNNLVY